MASLHPQQAIKLARAQLAYIDAKRATDRARKERDRLPDQYRDRLPADEWLTVAGYRLRRSMRSTGQRFSLLAYLERHRLTKAMEPFITCSSYEHLQAEPVE